MRRSVVMWFPAWSVVAATWDEELPEVTTHTAVAVLRAGVVHECSAKATAAGVRVGMKRREAHLVCPDVVLVAENPLRDRAFFDRVIIWLAEVVSQHTVLRPGLLGFQARGLARFYGGERQAAEHLIQRAATHSLPVEARIGVADDLFSAVLAATHARGHDPVSLVSPGQSAHFLEGLPVAVLEDEPTVSLLTRLGVSTLKEFVALGESAVRERLGSTGEHLYRLATGTDQSTLNPGGAPVDPEQHIDFLEPYALVDQVAFGVRLATDEYYERLVAAGRVCTAVRITITLDNGYRTERVWVHPRFFTSSDLVDRVRWQLEQFFRDTDTTSEFPPGVESVNYQALNPEDRVAHEPGLWGHGPDARVHQVFSRVQGLVGAQGVLTAHSLDARLATDSQVLTPWGDAKRDSDPPGPLPGSLPKPLPGTVFAAPRPIALVDHTGQSVVVTEGSLSADPAVMVWNGHQRALTSWAGPWPVWEQWWDRDRHRLVHRLQVLDERGVGWLVIAQEQSLWHLEARYD